MGRTKELQDLNILMAISGCEDLGNLGIQIEEDYLRRERQENRREAGYYVREPVLERTDLEKAIWKSAKALEELALVRWQKTQDEKDMHLEKEYDEDRMHPYIPKIIIKI